MKTSRLLLLLILLAAAAALGWQIHARLDDLGGEKKSRDRQARPVPVVVAPVERGPIARERAFTGTLEAHAEFVAAPKLGGILEHLAVDLGDPVIRGQVIARLDNAEFVQAVAEAEAEREVARANLAEAQSLLKIAARELKRVDQLSERGVSSASQRDTAQAEQLARKAHVQVTRAQLAQAEARLETARIRLGYTEVRADWDGQGEQRLVAERYVDQGETVSANSELLRIVALDPIKAVIFVTEKEYAGLRPGQSVSLSTDAYPNRSFNGVIERVAPVFREATRQARIEVRADNPDLALKPGMFVRAGVVLERLAEATVIPAQALTRRDEVPGVFRLADDGGSVSWLPVTPGIRQGERLQIVQPELSGRVVVLGQQLLSDGAAVILSEDR